MTLSEDGPAVALSALPALPGTARADLPRAYHYGEFYGLKPLPDAGQPLLVVHGNCQAESLRVLLQGAPESPCASVRIPALHEITAEEVPLLERLLDRCAVVLTQPVSGGYHGLPLGTDDVRRTAARARTVVFPIIRFAGLHPYQVVTNSPDQRPPMVPYHDLRTVLQAAGFEPGPPLDTAAVEAVAAWSTQALRRREDAAGAVPVHDLLRGAGLRATNTINHPGNPVLVGMARRVQRTLGWPETAVDPGRELLDSVHAPLERAVRDAVDPTARVSRVSSVSAGSPMSTDWVVDGRPLADASVVRAQLAFYCERPDVVRFVLTRAAEQLRCLRGPS